MAHRRSDSLIGYVEIQDCPQWASAPRAVSGQSAADVAGQLGGASSISSSIATRDASLLGAWARRAATSAPSHISASSASTTAPTGSSLPITASYTPRTPGRHSVSGVSRCPARCRLDGDACLPFCWCLRVCWLAAALPTHAGSLTRAGAMMNRPTRQPAHRPTLSLGQTVPLRRRSPASSRRYQRCHTRPGPDWLVAADWMKDSKTGRSRTTAVLAANPPRDRQGDCLRRLARHRSAGRHRR